MADSSKKAESQVERFREAARELETDQSEENFDRLVKKIARPAPKKTDKGEKAD